MACIGERYMSATMISILVVFFFVAAFAYGETGRASSEYQPKGSIREYFLGAWKLVSTEYKYPDGHKTPYPDLGQDAAGFLLYTPSGHMCAQLMKPGRPQWSAEDTPSAAEAVFALDGFISYCGQFEVREKQHIMVHYPETASSPNYPGITLERPYHLVSEDRFYFLGPGTEKQKNGAEVPVVWTITWERLK
jgi:hypothetical protein